MPGPGKLPELPLLDRVPGRTGRQQLRHGASPPSSKNQPSRTAASTQSKRNAALVLRSSKAVLKAASESAGRWGGAAPDPGFGAGVELGGGDPGGVVDLVRVGEGLAGQGGLAEQAPPALLKVEPARADRDEGVGDPGMLRQPLAGGLAVVAGEIVRDDPDLSSRVGLLDQPQEPLVVDAAAGGGGHRDLLSVGGPQSA